MSKPDKILYSAIAGKTLPLVGLLALLSVGVGTGDEMDGGVGLPTWVTVAALVIGVVKVVADAWAAHRAKSYEDMANRVEEAEEKAKTKTKEAEELQKEVYKLQAEVSLAKTQAQNAGVSTEELSLRE